MERSIVKKMWEPHINSSDMFCANPTEQFLGFAKPNIEATESIIGSSRSPGCKDFSQKTDSSETHSFGAHMEFSESENHANFMKYISQKPLLGKSVKSMTKPYMLGPSCNVGNEEIESATQVKSSFCNLLEMVKALASEVKTLKGIIENHVKRYDEQITSEQKNAEEIHQVIGKFETFLCSYRENERKNYEVMENGFKSIKDAVLESNAKILKASDSISENQESLKAKIMEVVQSVKDVSLEAEHQADNVSKQLLQAFSEKFGEYARKRAEQTAELKSCINTSFQSLIDVINQKPVCRALSGTNVISADKDVFEEKCLHPPSKSADTGALTKPKGKPFIETNRNSRSGYGHHASVRHNYEVPMLSLHQNFKTSEVEIVPQESGRIAEKARPKDKTERDIYELSGNHQSSNKENCQNNSRVQCTTFKRKQDANCTSVIQVKPDIFASPPKHRKITKFSLTKHDVKNSSHPSDDSDDEHVSFRLSSESSPCLSINDLPLTKRSLAAREITQFANASENLEDIASPTSEQIWM